MDDALNSSGIENTYEYSFAPFEASLINFGTIFFCILSGIQNT